MNHLLDECPYIVELWDWATGIFCQSNRVRGNIYATINTLEENYNDNEEVNLCQTLTPDMIIWAIWKERNERIFHNESLPIIKLIEWIKKSIKGNYAQQ